MKQEKDAQKASVTPSSTGQYYQSTALASETAPMGSSKMPQEFDADTQFLEDLGNATKQSLNQKPARPGSMSHTSKCLMCCS